MKKTIELVRYQLQVYFGGSKYAMPFIAMMAFLFIMYSMKPLDIVDSFSITCFAVFLVMAWIGHSAAASENNVMEQIQLLRVRKETLYYVSKVLFLIVIGFYVSCICVLFPIMQNIINHMEMFLRPLTAFDVGNAFVLLFGSAFAGGTLGNLLHPRVMAERRLSIALTVLYALLTVVRPAVIQEFPLFRYIAWIFPPLDSVASKNYFSLMQTSGIFLSLIIYGLIFSAIKSIICFKSKF